MKEYPSFRKHMDGSYMPSNEKAVEFDEKVKAGQEVFMDARRSRSVRYHNRIFSILHSFYDHTAASDQFPSFDAFREYLTIKSGFYESIVWPDGTLHLRALSWNFAMPQDEFDTLRNAIATLIAQDILNDTDPDWIIEEIMRF